MPASEYARSTFGRPEASNLRHAADISSALAHPDAFITAATASATSSSGKSEAIFTASGLYPTPGAIDNFPSRMLEQMQTAAALNALGHSDVAGCTAPLIAGSSGIARFSRPFNQHSALVLPFRQLVFLEAHRALRVFTSIFYPTGTQFRYLQQSPKNRSQKDRDRQRVKRAYETSTQKELRLARQRLRNSSNYARKQQQKASSDRG
jgi:hypothetical protein